MQDKINLAKKVLKIVNQAIMYFSSWNEYDPTKSTVTTDGYFLVKLRDGTVVRDCYKGAQRNKFLHDGLLKKGSGSPLVVVKKNIVAWKVQK